MACLDWDHVGNPGPATTPTRPLDADNEAKAKIPPLSPSAAEGFWSIAINGRGCLGKEKLEAVRAAAEEGDATAGSGLEM